MPNSTQVVEVMSYLIGYRLGSQMIPQMLPGITPEDIDGANIAKGILEGLAGNIDMNLAEMDVESIQKEFLATLKARESAIGDKNLEMGKTYMEENAKREGVTCAPSGLQYEVINEGGQEVYDPEKHGDAPTAKVMYKGTLIDGTLFDESDAPVEFNIRQVIPGFTEALMNMPIGAKWRVTIPADLAYGENGPGPIGPNSTLIFEMELLELIK